MQIYSARFVVPISTPPIVDGAVAVDGDSIAYVGPRRSAPAGDVVELGDAALLPGLVNSHCHLELTAFRGLLDALPFREWIVTLQSAKQAVMNEARFLDSARLGIAEGLLAGVTSFGDTCDSGVAMRALIEAGARGIMYQELFGPDPAQVPSVMEELRRKIERHRSIETALVHVGISPHAPYTVSDALFAAATAYARDASLPMAVHIAESDAERRLISEGEGDFADGLRRRGIDVRVRGRSPVELLARLGVLGAAPQLIHCVDVDAADRALIAAHGCAVAHCPASNAKLGHGIAPLIELLDAGITVGLGSDSVASNDRMDLLDEARLAVLAQRARLGRHDALSASRALELATLGGARALGLGRVVGSLERGKQADLAAFPLGAPRTTPVYDIEEALVFSLGSTPASLVTVGGVALVRDGAIVADSMRRDTDLARRVGETAAALHAWRDSAHRS